MKKLKLRTWNVMTSYPLIIPIPYLFFEQSDSDGAMSVNEVHLQSVLPDMETLGTVNTVKKREKKSRDRKGFVKSLLRLISDMF